VELEEVGEANRAVSEEKNNEFKVMTFGEENSLEVPEEFSPKLDNPVSLSIPCVVGNVRVNKALCDFSPSISMTPYFISNRLT